MSHTNNTHTTSDPFSTCSLRKCKPCRHWYLVNFWLIMKFINYKNIHLHLHKTTAVTGNVSQAPHLTNCSALPRVSLDELGIMALSTLGSPLLYQELSNFVHELTKQVAIQSDNNLVQQSAFCSHRIFLG